MKTGKKSKKVNPENFPLVQKLSTFSQNKLNNSDKENQPISSNYVSLCTQSSPKNQNQKPQSHVSQRSQSNEIEVTSHLKKKLPIKPVVEDGTIFFNSHFIFVVVYYTSKLISFITSILKHCYCVDDLSDIKNAPSKRISLSSLNSLYSEIYKFKSNFGLKKLPTELLFKILALLDFFVQEGKSIILPQNEEVKDEVCLFPGSFILTILGPR